MSNVELKPIPCPFCGCDAESGSGFSPLESVTYVWCSNADCYLSPIGRDERLFTIGEWNRRASPSIPPAGEEPTWSKTPPTAQGWYWHWNGDPGHQPIPTSVIYSGTTGTCFVSIGQLGITEAIFCDKYGGYWMRMREPSVFQGASTAPAESKQKAMSDEDILRTALIVGDNGLNAGVWTMTNEDLILFARAIRGEKS